jgi:hypothetical protein
MTLEQILQQEIKDTQICLSREKVMNLFTNEVSKKGSS